MDIFKTSFKCVNKQKILLFFLQKACCAIYSLQGNTTVEVQIVLVIQDWEAGLQCAWVTAFGVENTLISISTSNK